MDVVRGEGNLFKKMGEKHKHRPLWVRIIIIFLSFTIFVLVGILLAVSGGAVLLSKTNGTDIVTGISNLLFGSGMFIFGLITIWRNVQK
jgi:hypothetical protein